MYRKDPFVNDSSTETILGVREEKLFRSKKELIDSL